MTVRRLLAEADSMELSRWRLYLQAAAAERDEQMQRAREDRRLMGADD